MHKTLSAILLLLICTFLFVVAKNTGATAAIIPIAKFTSAEMPGGAPVGWNLEKKSGTPSMKMEKDGSIYFLNLLSAGNASFGVRKEAHVNVKEFRVLSWRWKVDKLPVGGDVRKTAADDQALQIYVAFKETGFPALLNTPIIGYIWDNEAPKGWSGRSTQVGGDKLRYIVLRNKTDKTGQWYTERRNVYEDYKTLFGDIKGGEPQGPTTGLQIYINSQRTKSVAESSIGEIYFSNEPADLALTAPAKEKIFSKGATKISKPKREPISKFSPGKNWGAANCININIEFDINSTDISENINSKLQPVIEYLIKYPKDTITITGHTDNVGNEKYNLILSKRRADSVKSYLVQKFNLDSERLIVRAVGTAEPPADNDTPEGQKQNRCVMIQDCPD